MIQYCTNYTTGDESWRLKKQLIYQTCADSVSWMFIVIFILMHFPDHASLFMKTSFPNVLFHLPLATRKLNSRPLPINHCNEKNN